MQISEDSQLIRQKLSKQLHPDINPDEAAHERFIEVSKGELERPLQLLMGSV